MSTAIRPEISQKNPYWIPKHRYYELILKDGTNYIKVRDLAAALNLEVGNKGNIAVLTTKA